MQTLWRGTLSFGLINVPVRLHSGTKEHQFDFHLYHEKDKGAVRYARICVKEGKEIPWKEIVKGFKVSKNKIVILTDEDFEKANVEKSHSIEVIGFADEKKIDSVLFEKPYFLMPDKDTVKPYVLLREALRRSEKIGIARFILRNREHLAVIKAYKKIIILNQLRYVDEIRPAHAEFKEVKVSKKEIDMAAKLIDQLTEEFYPEDYKDTYEEDLKRIIKQKAAGKKIRVRGKEAKSTKVHDLEAALKASLKQKKKRKTA